MDAVEHFAAKLTYETDVSDVHAALDARTPKLTVVDTRSAEAWDQGRLPGAVHLPTAEIAERAAGLVPRDHAVVTYCWGPGCNGATRAALAFARLGFEVREMIGGYEYWVREGFAVRTAAGARSTTSPPRSALFAPADPFGVWRSGGAGNRDPGARPRPELSGVPVMSSAPANWVESARDRARRRLAEARGWSPPPFAAAPGLGDDPATPVVQLKAAPSVDDGIPSAVRTAGAWSWRIVLFIITAYLLIRVVALLHIVIIPIAVALLLAALFEPVAAFLRNRGMNRSLAAGLVLLTALVVVFGGLTLIVQTFISQLSNLTAQVGDGIDEVQSWLSSGPLHLSQTQLSDSVEKFQTSITQNQSALTSSALSTATTLTEVLAGFFLTLFTLFFFLRDGGQIWTFLCRLLPRGARIPTARAGHYSWHTLVSYVRATVLVAFVDAVGIGIGLFVLRVPLALPLAALVFLGAFIPVVGATLSGAVAVLVALVTQGPVTALILLGVVIAVQQLEGHILQPLIMGRAVALHPLAVILAIATGVLVAGIVGGLVAVPLLAVLNTAIRYLADHPSGEPTPDRAPPGTTATDDQQASAEAETQAAQDAAEPTPPPADTSVQPA